MGKIDQYYWQHYSMESNPFSEEADLKPCYLSLQWQQYLDFLADLDNYQQTLVLLTGVPGVGKTSLIYELMARLSPQTRHLILNAKDCQGAEHVLEILRENFQAPIESSLDLYDNANQQLLYLQQSNKRYLLLIDDADELPLDVQELLFHLVQQQESSAVALQVILIGDESLIHAMQQIAQSESGKPSNLVNTLTLDPFTYEEAVKYLQHRFEQAGGPRDHLPLNSDDIEYIYQQSEGVAEKINELAETFLRGYVMEQQGQNQENKTPLLKRYIWWICTIAVIAVLLIWVLPMFQSHSMTNTQPISLPTQPQDQQQDQSTNQSIDDNNNQPQGNPNPDYSQDANNRYQNLSNAAQNPPQAQAAAQQPATSGAQPVPANAQSTSANQVSVPQAGSQNTAAQSAPQTEPVDAASNDDAVETPAPTHHTAKKVSSYKGEMHHQKTRHTTKNLTPVEKQLLKINPKYYTLQLIGSHNKADIVGFIRHHKLQNEAVYFHTYLNGQDWYVLISGDYATVAQANAARSKLPVALRQLNPWVRTFASVHKSITLKR